ncbi:PREDICTED: peroxisomal leader peptide-processing protease [Gekko japonicus]|uniref:Peroxisomal leader peptide-processing protease n=1 Tax=Gekko japonicus TaxID=146911 RepID=A0ABM1KVR6_GEKJA|nr:PREDICTED: peroxisomal leader peptide-processing protease [Gekko japonicus]
MGKPGGRSHVRSRRPFPRSGLPSQPPRPAPSAPGVSLCFWRRAGGQVGCVVRVSHSRGAGEGAPESPPRGPWSCSGVLLSPRPAVVLCHGAIFSPFLLASERPDWSQRAALLAGSFSPDLRIRVLRPGGSSAGLRRPGEASQGGGPAVRFHPLSSGPEEEEEAPGGLERHDAELLALVPCRPFQRAFAKVFGASEQWHFGVGDEEAAAAVGKGEAGSLGDELRFLHWFALLRLLGGGGGGDLGGAGAVGCAPAALLSKGDPLLACGSPFGSFCPDIFLNTLSKGIVSNLAGEGNALILTDARCLPGTEGGAIFAISAAGPQLVGIVVAPLCWKSNEWVGLTLVCAVDGILESLRSVLAEPRRFPNIWLPPLRLGAKARKAAVARGGPVQQMLAAVVLVECGLSWGSGVIVSSKVVLTCRHVVSGVSSVRVRIRPGPEQTLVTKGKVVFVTQDASPYDVALVELEDGLSMFVEPVLASKFFEGEDVSMVGFGAFGQACGPSVTSGILSAVITVEETPVMLQATCAVHGGSSGGALFATHSGELLGIVASNTRDSSIGATYPHLNFSLPITVLQPALSEYTRSRDLRGFRELDRVADRVRVVWRLQREPGEVPLSKL